LLVAILLAGGSTRAARGDDVPAIKIGIVGSVTDAPIFIADAKGYFRDEGLALDYQKFPSAANMVAPLGAGQLDVGAGGTSAGLFNAIGRGLDMRVVADKASDPPGYGFAPFLVRTDLIKSGRFKTLRDIKGMTVAVSAVGSSSWPELNAVAEKAGLTFADVKKVALDYPDHVVGFKNGSIDASVTIEPFATAIVKSGDATRVLSSDQFYPNQEVAVLIYSGAFIKAHRDTGLRFMRAYLKGVRYYNDALARGTISGPNADDVIKILTDRTAIKDPAVYREVTANGVDPNGKIGVASMAKDLAFYRAQGAIEVAVTAEQTVDPSFAAEAVRQLGPYRPARR
jgi:NitT/TauT family transport system substrate-binding protein